MSWNVALDKIMEIKKAYFDRFGDDGLYSYGNCRTYLDHWVERLDIKEYKDILFDLHRVQCEDLILLHYRLPHSIDGADYYKAYDGLFAECRSVVIDIRKGELALTPFKKFMNLNERSDTSEERIRELLRSAKVVEFSDKLDGSMQSARFYDGKLVMSGSRAVDRNASFRLENGYRYVETHDNYMSMIRDNPDLTFIFEYIFDDDVHVVNYSSKEKGLYLIGIRNSIDGREYHYYEVLKFADEYGVMTTVLSNIDLDSAMDILDKADGLEKEGFVVNIDGFRIKMKSRDYVMLNTAIWSLGEDDHVLFNAVRFDMLDDVLPKINEPLRSKIASKADKIIEYARVKEAKVMKYMSMLNKSGLSEKKDVMVWINDNVPHDVSTYVRALYLGKDVDYLKGVKVEDILSNTCTDDAFM
ncbi:MAG: hypothetical protein E7Z67_02460 [Thermoplasmata archaeon]|nr:hypothetical protein [Thermoplasmata archaeon]